MNAQCLNLKYLQEPTLISFDEELEELPFENLFKKCRKSVSNVSICNSGDDSFEEKYDKSRRRKSDFGFVLHSREALENEKSCKAKV